MFETTNICRAPIRSWALCWWLGINSEQMRSSWKIRAEMTAWYLYCCCSPSRSLRCTVCRLDTMPGISNIALVGSAFAFRLLDDSSLSQTLFLLPPPPNFFHYFPIIKYQKGTLKIIQHCLSTLQMEHQTAAPLLSHRLFHFFCSLFLSSPDTPLLLFFSLCTVLMSLWW